MKELGTIHRNLECLRDCIINIDKIATALGVCGNNELDVKLSNISFDIHRTESAINEWLNKELDHSVKLSQEATNNMIHAALAAGKDK